MAKNGSNETNREVDLGRLTENLGYVIRRLQLEIFQHVNEALSDLNIRTGQYSVLTVIALNPGLKQREVAAALGIKRPNFVKMFDDLEARGLAIRKPSPTDRRSHALYLTTRGDELMVQLNAVVAEHEHYWKEKIGGSEYDQLLSTLQRMSFCNKNEE